MTQPGRSCPRRYRYRPEVFARDATLHAETPIHDDQAAWMHRFLSNWPAGSPAHTAYFNRITEGPEFTVSQAVRLAGGLSS